MASDWEPRIVTFMCDWCLYSRLDQADVARIKKEPGVKIIKIPCLGRIDPVHVLMTLQEGIDGVIVAGCNPGDCHYKRGNYMAENRMMLLQQVLETLGGDGRVRFAHIATGERGQLPRLVKEMTESVRSMGPIQLLE